MSDLSSFTPAELEELKNNPELRELFHAQDDPYGYPEPANRDNLLKFFRDILSLVSGKYDELSKTGNLKDGEIGWLSLPQRNYLSVANFCQSEGYNAVANHLRNKANIIVNTSLSRKARFLELAVTQKRVSQNVLPKTVSTKSGLFGTTTTESGGEDN